MINDDSVIGGLAAELESALAPPEAGAAEEGAKAPAPPPGTPEEQRALLDDLRPLGFMGLLCAVSEAPPPEEEVHAELPGQVAARIRAQLAEDREKIVASGATAPPALPDDAPLADLVRVFLERKGEKAPLVLRKIVENAVYDFYELKEHALFVDDVGRALDVIKSVSGASDNAQTFMKRLAALSSDTAKFILGLFPEQLQLIYKIQANEAERREIDAAFDMFAPRVIWKRVFAIAKTLITREKRFRLALQVWARLHGVAITREHMGKIEAALAVKDTRALLARAIERAEMRRRILEFRKSHEATIAAIERAY
jgi:hypothetical protein